MIRWGDAYLCQWPECDAPRHEGTEYCEAHLPTARLRRVGRSRPSAAQGVPRPSSHRDSLDAEEWEGAALRAEQPPRDGEWDWWWDAPRCEGCSETIGKDEESDRLCNRCLANAKEDAA